MVVYAGYSLVSEDTHPLRLVSELPELREGYVNRLRFAYGSRNGFKSRPSHPKEKTRVPEWVVVYAGYSLVSEDTHPLRLVSELPELREGYVNRLRFAYGSRNGFKSRPPCPKEKTRVPKWVLVFFGGDGRI